MSSAPQRPQVPPFQIFLDEHRSAVLGFLRAMVGPTDADDCFQETFMAALRTYENHDGSNPRAWVLTIARNKAIDHYRARKRAPLPVEEVPEVGRSDAPPPDTAIWSRVAELPEKQRTALALRFAGDLAYREVGAAMDTSEEAARRSVYEGLKRLRADVDPEEVAA